MSRVIKFRAWDKKKKEMYQDCGVRFTDCGWLLVMPSFMIGGGDSYPLDFFELMQFTGLLDKNGKEIYEGDIFELIELEIKGKQSEFGKVVVKFGEYDTTDIESGDVSLGWYVEGYHGYKRNDGTKDRYKKLDSLLSCQESRWRTGWIIIGNIYETPELLEGAKDE